MPTTQKKTAVYYDGSCPLCNREIEFYQKRRGADEIDWVDVSQTKERLTAPDLSKQNALARFHVRDAEGHLKSGGEAFATLWQNLPGFRSIGVLASYQPFKFLLRVLYGIFLVVRPWIQRAAPMHSTQRDKVMPNWLLRDLRSDHAGETGAVVIYQSILAVSRDPAIRDFAKEHLATEKDHLRKIEEVFPPSQKSLALPLWRVAAFITGALPTLISRNAVYVTIDAVENFVDQHYAVQIERLDKTALYPDLRALLASCREDELRHRKEARDNLSSKSGFFERIWRKAILTGSRAAVAVARVF